MKILRSVIFGIALLLLTSCNTVSSWSRNATPLVLTLEIAQREIHSFEEIRCQVTLLNQGDTNILVHSRLHYVAIPIPASISEMLILIFDSSGNRIAKQYYPNYAPPSIDTLEELQPGDQVTKIFYLRTSGFFDSSLFKQGEKYTIVAIYQNNIDINKTIDGVEAPAWIGSIRSNEETFIILPPED
jgi:hypothetical protein